jgi:hypothetical protein
MLNSFGVVAVRLAEIFRCVEPFLLVTTLSVSKNPKRQIVYFLMIVSVFVNLYKNRGAVYPIDYFFQSIGLA